uniref:Putative ubiquitin conjugating enzyme n=1 Tax=Corethrella appendiculata TaxID=1370023 RepID=U5EX63_9DIPT
MTLDSCDKLLSTVLQEYQILAEYKRLQSEDIGGIYVIPSFENSFLWFGVFFVRTGPYKDGIFRFTLTLPEKFPNDSNIPTIKFESEIYHPLICNRTNIVELTEAFPQWKTNENHIWQFLKFLQYIFYQFDDYINVCEKILNDEALKLMQQNRDEFNKKIGDCVKLSKSRIYDQPTANTDRNYIVFEPFDVDVHGNVLENLKKNITESVTPPPSSGLSWVKEGVFQPLSKGN